MVNKILRRAGKLAGALLAMAVPAAAEGVCRRMAHDGNGYVVCHVDAAQEPRLQLWLTAPDGSPFGNFERIKSALQPQSLIFAMNAVMYHEDRAPVGLFVSESETAGHLVTAGGGGNFGLLPNGVFCAGGARPFQVIETLAFEKARPDCRLATQSGPMLVIDGDLHPRFLVDSDSRYIRNGVGVSADGQQAWFAMSDRAVTFHEFGRLFRDGLGARNALYFDGSISRLYAPELNRADFGRMMGPVIGLVDETAASQ